MFLLLVHLPPFLCPFAFTHVQFWCTPPIRLDARSLSHCCCPSKPTHITQAYTIPHKHHHANRHSHQDTLAHTIASTTTEPQITLADMPRNSMHYRAIRHAHTIIQSLEHTRHIYTSQHIGHTPFHTQTSAHKTQAGENNYTRTPFHTWTSTHSQHRTHTIMHT
mgnify:CR=1 FL=1